MTPAVLVPDDSGSLGSDVEAALRREFEDVLKKHGVWVKDARSVRSALLDDLVFLARMYKKFSP